MTCEFNFDATAVATSLEGMELPPATAFHPIQQQVVIQTPGGLGSVMTVADGGSWIKSHIQKTDPPTSSAEVQVIDVASFLAESNPPARTNP